MSKSASSTKLQRDQLYSIDGFASKLVPGFILEFWWCRSVVFISCLLVLRIVYYCMNNSRIYNSILAEVCFQTLFCGKFWVYWCCIFTKSSFNKYILNIYQSVQTMDITMETYYNINYWYWEVYMFLLNRVKAGRDREIEYNLKFWYPTCLKYF